MKTPTLSLLAVLLMTPATPAAVNVLQNANGLKYAAVLAGGPVGERYDIVFIGDGFKQNQQADFNARVNDAVTALRARLPYSDLMCAFNIWRVNVISTDSGVDH